ncbi:hypothetical protein [Candidatus Entotheonella palauensis]|uniref:Uncharacterized protein n=1 Tax=Candidatus Entotheonella gemina TaxID=1429439 RepID=W4LDT7_9BACT|nr:hypothetical protein [Candidatus Entotheonella palauensis]ETW96253.1 MAG: hypothetical protein ETSY2_46780 [Candidatus Entotheonella gemina]
MIREWRGMALSAFAAGRAVAKRPPGQISRSGGGAGRWDWDTG